jgi:hypothetical protein
VFSSRGLMRLLFPQAGSVPHPDVPNQAPVIHVLFVAGLIPVCLSTFILGIIAARRAVPPLLVDRARQDQHRETKPEAQPDQHGSHE